MKGRITTMKPIRVTSTGKPWLASLAVACGLAGAASAQYPVAGPAMPEAYYQVRALAPDVPYVPVGSWNLTHSGLNTYSWFQPLPPYDKTWVNGRTYYRLNPYGRFLLQQAAAEREALWRTWNQAYLKGWSDRMTVGR
jgi:hypothetical protein